MSDDSVLAHLADRFATGRENLATEALNYILTRSHSARVAVAETLAPVGADLSAELAYEAQVAADEDSIPDLFGRDASGSPALIVESKFWAGLTAQQPNAYLKLLTRTEASALVFLAPHRRVESLWPELIRRVKEEHDLDEASSGLSEQLRWQRIDDGRVIGITTWRLLLNQIRHAVQRDGDARLVGDIDQLIALCDRVDDEAFEPIRDEELAQAHGRRILQYCDLADDVISNMASKAAVSTKGLRASGGKGYYNRHVLLHGWACTLRVSSSKWSRLAATPLWLEIRDREWKPSGHVRAALARLSATHPPEMLLDDGSYQVPLFITPGMDRDGVLASLVGRVEHVVELIGSYIAAHPEAAGSSDAPAESQGPEADQQ